MANYINNNLKEQKQPSYSDLDPSFLRSSKDNDISIVKNTKSVRNSIMSLLSTAYGERLFQPNIGGSLRSVLFDPIDPISTFEIKDRILNTIRNHEPRVGVLYVDVISKSNENSYTVNIEFSISSTGERDTITTTLERIR
jgi:phage baseplate assembly protein W